MPSPTPRRENRLVAFLDLTQFARAVRPMSPEAVFEFLQGYYAVVSIPVKTSGGNVIKCIGDSMLITWPDTAADAGVKMLLEVRRSVANYMKKAEKPCQLDVKAHFGPVAVGVLGGLGNEIEDVIGDTVNQAALIRSAGFAISPEAFAKTRPDTRKLLKKHTPAVTYVPADSTARD